MDTKEDLVRQRLERERLASEERERKRAENEAATLEQNLQKRIALLDAIDAEAERIFKALETADWSQAKLVTFEMNKRHWWSRRQRRDYAMFTFMEAPVYKHVLRSDGLLYLYAAHAYGGIWRRPAGFYAAPSADQSYRIPEQLTNLEAHLFCLMRWTPEEAQRAS